MDQKKLEDLKKGPKETRMKPTEKRDALVDQMLRPLLRERGFQSSGCNWWKELEDSWLLIHMKNSRWNGESTGANFCFEISVSGKDEIRDKLSNQWIHNQFCHLTQNNFLPYYGFLSPRVEATGYKIDGYRNYLPLDDPLDEIAAQIRGDFERYILPPLERLCTKADWEDLYRERLAASDTADIRLLRYYSAAHRLSCSENDLPQLLWMQRNLALTPEEIVSHFDWLEIIRQNSPLPDLDTKAFLLRSLQKGNE